MNTGGTSARLFLRDLAASVASIPRRPLTHLLATIGYLIVASRTTGIGVLPAIVAFSVFAIGLLGVRRRHFADVAMPFIVFAAFYHWLGWLAPTVTGRGVHVFFPYWFDKTIFGIGDLANQWSCNEVFAAHHLPAIDFVTGLAYLSFLPTVLIFAAFLAMSDRQPIGVRRSRRFGWTFLGVNLAGFLTYILYPVAPPWYVAARGFGPVDPAAHASPAALARWDDLIGVPYFDRFYAQATEVFGALPSLHCAYPMLLTLFAWEMGRWRLAALLLGYQLVMCFSAVYLQHHYVTDVIAGSAYAIVGHVVGRALAALIPATTTAASEGLVTTEREDLDVSGVWNRPTASGP